MPKHEIAKHFKACELSQWSHHRRAEEKSTCRQAHFRRFGDRDLESRETSQRNYRKGEMRNRESTLCISA